jgi:hypothetical protein
MIANIGSILAHGTPLQISQIAPIVAVPVAIAAILPPLLTLVYSMRSNARTRRLENERFEWERLNELAKALYNKDHEYGLWRQQLAIAELGSFARKREAALNLLAAADAHFRGRAAMQIGISAADQNHAERLLPSFDDALDRLQRRSFIGVRLSPSVSTPQPGGEQ